MHWPNATGIVGSLSAKRQDNSVKNDKKHRKCPDKQPTSDLAGTPVIDFAAPTTLVL